MNCTLPRKVKLMYDLIWPKQYGNMVNNKEKIYDAIQNKKYVCTTEQTDNNF